MGVPVDTAWTSGEHAGTFLWWQDRREYGVLPCCFPEPA